MFTSLLHFETSYQLKRKAFIGFGLIFLVFGYMLGSQGFAPANVNFNSAYQIGYNTALTSLGSVFAIMFFTISGILRDRQYKIEAILYTTSIQKNQFFFSRFTGVFLASLTTFTMALIGFLLGTLSPQLDPDRLMAFELTFYLWTWITIVVPNIFICTAIIFSVGALTKSSIATYVSAILIYAAYFLCSIFFNSPLMANAAPGAADNMFMAAIGDPFGLSAFFEQTQFWTPFEKNTKLISFSGYFMWNRLLWLTLSGTVLLAAYKFFSFKKINIKAKKKQETSVEIFDKKIYKTINRITLDTKYEVSSFISQLKIDLKFVFKSLPFIAIILIWIFIVASEIYTRLYLSGAYNDSLYPTTNLLIDLIKEPLPVLSLLLIIFYSGELIWRERSLNFNSIIDSTPASNIVFFLSKGITLILLPFILITIGIVIAIAFQLSSGYAHLEIGQYLSMYYFNGTGFLFNIMLALLILNITPNKYLGMVVIGLIIVIFQSQMSGKLGLLHPLLRLGKFPDIEFNNMVGYGDYATRFHYFAVFWTALGIIFSFLAFKIWQRGATSSLKFKPQKLKLHWSVKSRILITVTFLLFIVSGCAIFYNTNIASDYTTNDDVLNFREGYELKYKKYEALASPVLIDIKTKVDLYPSERRFSIKANYILENTSSQSISKILVFERTSLKEIVIEGAKLITYDSIYNTYIFEFNKPLQPKEQTTFSYKLIKEKNGFEIDRSIVNNGAYITSSTFEPSFGYRKGIEITNNFERKKRGLPEYKRKIISDHHLQSEEQHNARKINFETIVSTENNQTAIAPGELIKKWSKDNRTFYQYKTSSKIVPAIAYFSSEYTTRKEKYKGVSIEQYYDAFHNFNIENIQKHSKIALDYCIENFGSYPFNHLRIAEIPAHWPFGGFAHPGTISMVEDRLYLVDYRNTTHFNLVAKRAIHEVAHQWFGHILSPKNTAGASMFTEGFAKYAEAVIMEKEYGMKAIRQLSKTANRTYFSGRSYASEKEPALYRTEGQGYLAYGKNYTSMLALRELIGEDMLNSVIKKMIDNHKEDVALSVTSLEFLNELYQVTSEENHKVIDDWFKRVIIYDVSIKNASVKKLEDNTYEVIISIDANRFETNEIGEEKPIGINEFIQIGLFTKHPDNIASKGIILLKKYQINKKENTIKIIVNEVPKYVSIDPLGSRLDNNLLDNTFRLN